MSHTNSKRLFVFKADTGVAGRLCVSEEIRLLLSSYSIFFTTASYKSGVLQAKENSTEFSHIDS